MIVWDHPFSFVLLPQVALTDVHDSWVVNALHGVHAGLFVRAVVVEQGPSPLLSMRTADGALWGNPPAPEPVDADTQPPQTLDTAKVKVGHAARGYVKAVTKAGVFVVMARNAEARVRLSQLKNGFVEDPAAAFPVGSLFTGRVVATEGGRCVLCTVAQGIWTLYADSAIVCCGSCVHVPAHVFDGDACHENNDRPPRMELSARTSTRTQDLSDLSVGQVVRGRVARVQPFGVFVALEGGKATGLAHISECSHDFVRDLTTLFKTGQGVSAVVYVCVGMVAFVCDVSKHVLRWSGLLACRQRGRLNDALTMGFSTAVTARVTKLDQESHKLSLSLKGLGTDTDGAEEEGGGESEIEDAMDEDMLLAMDHDGSEDEEGAGEDEGDAMEGSALDGSDGDEVASSDEEEAVTAAPEVDRVGWEDEGGNGEGEQAADMDEPGMGNEFSCAKQLVTQY